MARNSVEVKQCSVSNKNREVSLKYDVYHSLLRRKAIPHGNMSYATWFNHMIEETCTDLAFISSDIFQHICNKMFPQLLM